MKNIIRTTALVTTKIGPKLWRLKQPLIFDQGFIVYEVPEGFITDGASNIRPLYSLCPPMSGLTAEVLVLHDYLYSKDCDIPMSRLLADKITLTAMACAQVPLMRRHLIYAGVRIGGKSSFKKGFSTYKLKDAYHNIQ